MFPFVFSKCRPQWKNIKTAKYKSLQHESVSMVSILYVYIDFFPGLMKILINLHMHSIENHICHKIPKFLNISDLEYVYVYSHPRRLAIFKDLRKCFQIIPPLKLLMLDHFISIKWFHG